MASPVRLYHDLATTKIDHASCKGFEDEAFQALTGLVHYTQGSAGQRDAWYRAIWNAHINQTGTLRAGPNNKSFFYSAVLNRKNSAFGTSLAVPKGGTLDTGEAAGGFLAVVFYDWTVRTGNAVAKTNFATDEARRLFDRASPLIAAELGQAS